MSKTDNLHDFLVDIADAVREKKGTTEPINAQNLSEEIRGIESGGEVAVLAEDIVDDSGKGVRNIKTLRFAEGVTTINTYATYQTSIENVYLPSTLVEIKSAAFHTSQNLSYVSPMPKSLSVIGSQAFAYCGKIEMLDFRDMDKIPTLTDSNAFGGNTTIVVPDNLYDEWKSADNWKVHENRIVSEQMWNEQNQQS